MKLVTYQASVNRIMLCRCPDEKPAVEIRERAGHLQSLDSISSRHIQLIRAPRVHRNTKRSDALICDPQEEKKEVRERMAE